MPSKQRRVELKFQDHIIDSYKACGGYARKWATDMQVGLPDLCAALPGIGGHWVEVKHRPEWSILKREYGNPLDKMQVRNARLYMDAGALVFGAVIVEGSNAIGSHLVIFHPLAPVLMTDHTIYPYVPGKGYDVATAAREAQHLAPF